MSLKQRATACYSEYVDLHGDIKKAYKAQISSGIASQSEYGKAHYEGIGASKGRALPQGCGEHLQVSSTCYESYVDTYPDLIEAWQLSGQPKSLWGKTHSKTTENLSFFLTSKCGDAVMSMPEEEAGGGGGGETKNGCTAICMVPPGTIITQDKSQKTL